MLSYQGELKQITPSWPVSEQHAAAAAAAAVSYFDLSWRQWGSGGKFQASRLDFHTSHTQRNKQAPSPPETGIKYM